MSLIFPMSAAVLLGMVFAQQAVINAAVSRLVGSPVAAATISVFLTLIFLLLILPFSGGTLRPSVLMTLPWWTVLAGIIGVGIVAVAAAIVPITGAALFFICLVAGQLLGATIADHIGAFGLPEKPVNPGRIAGLAFVMVGAFLVHRG